MDEIWEGVVRRAADAGATDGVGEAVGTQRLVAGGVRPGTRSVGPVAGTLALAGRNISSLHHRRSSAWEIRARLKREKPPRDGCLPSPVLASSWRQDIQTRLPNPGSLGPQRGGTICRLPGWIRARPFRRGFETGATATESQRMLGLRAAPLRSLPNPHQRLASSWGRPRPAANRPPRAN